MGGRHHLQHRKVCNWSREEPSGKNTGKLEPVVSIPLIVYVKWILETCRTVAVLLGAELLWHWYLLEVSFSGNLQEPLELWARAWGLTGTEV